MSTKNGNSTVVAVVEKKEMAQVATVQTKLAEQAIQATAIKELPIEELKNKAILLALLNQKDDELKDKQKDLTQFALTHDSNNATIYVTDAKGREFRSNSPKSIRQLIDFWMSEFGDAISENESKIKAVFA